MTGLTFYAGLAAIIVAIASLALLGWPLGALFALGGCALLWWEWRDLSRQQHSHDESWRP